MGRRAIENKETEGRTEQGAREGPAHLDVGVPENRRVKSESGENHCSNEDRVKTV